MTQLILAPLLVATIPVDAIGPAEDLRAAALLVVAAESAFVGRELMHLENVLAYAAFAASNLKGADEVLRGLAETTWPMVQSPIGLKNWFLAETRCDSVRDYCMLIDTLVAERRRADALHSGEACEMIRQQVAQLDAKYPGLQLSFGYIGNCDLGVGRRYDDRSWKVFTKLATPANNCSDVSWGGHATSMLGRMALQAEKALDSWCADRAGELAEGKIRSLTKIAA